jgi:hypothetical protein
VYFLSELSFLLDEDALGDGDKANSRRMVDGGWLMHLSISPWSTPTGAFVGEIARIAPIPYHCFFRSTTLDYVIQGFHFYHFQDLRRVFFARRGQIIYTEQLHTLLLLPRRHAGPEPHVTSRLKDAVLIITPLSPRATRSLPCDISEAQPP